MMLELRHKHADRGDDLYETPAVAVEAMLRAERLPTWLRIWEPACGRGNIVKVLRARGNEVLATDLIDYGSKHRNTFYGHDFLTKGSQDKIEAIITNPPFKLAEAFVRHAIDICPRVITLLRLPFYESVKRTDILEDSGLARIHVFRNRLPMMHRDGWTGPKATSAMAFAWYVWDRAHKGPTTIDRISWEGS
jgi:hypothetical protein